MYTQHSRQTTRAHMAASFALIALSLALPAGWARAQVWPADGAPVCRAPGDQHVILHSRAQCDELFLTWLDSRAGADTLAYGWFGANPPNGECARLQESVYATGAEEPSGVAVHGFVIGVPGCIPDPLASVWLQGSGDAQQVVVHVQVWLDHERTVADDGAAVRHHPRIAPSGIQRPDTAMVVVWSDERTGVPQIRAQRLTWFGLRTWGATGIRIAPTTSAQTEPEITRLQDGSSLVVWIDARAGGADVYALRLLEDGTAAPGWPATGLALESRPELASAPRLLRPESLGGGFALWEESGARFAGGRSIVVRRLLADGTPDPAWPLDGVPLNTLGTVDRLQDASTTGAEVVAVWTDTRAATPSNPTDLYAQWLTESGALSAGWPATGLAICSAPGRQDAARVSNSSSYAAFGWEDRRGSSADVFAELRNADATLPSGQWLPDGLAATMAAGDQTGPVVAAGNGGGALLAWTDARDVGTTALDIYAQAFSGEGEKLDAPPSSRPARPLLRGPSPNPMRGATRFDVDMPRSGVLRVEMLDLVGRRVRVLANGAYPAGRVSLSFDGRDEAGRALPAGLYRVHARTGDVTLSKSVIRLR